MISQQDAVGLATFDSEILDYVQPRSRRDHLAAILSALSKAQRHRASRLSYSLHRAAELFPRRGLAILFSDLIPSPEESPESVMEALQHIVYRGHDVICFHVLDHAELTLPYEGPTRFVDPESGQQIRLQPEAVRNDYQKEIRQFMDFYSEGCAQARIDYVQVDTSVSFDKVLVAYLLSRKSHF
jgi:uncharacterized protein (DUF58 family)